MDAGHLPDLTQCVLGGPDTIRSNATLLSNNLTQPVPEKPAIQTMISQPGQNTHFLLPYSTPVTPTLLN